MILESYGSTAEERLSSLQNSAQRALSGIAAEVIDALDDTVPFVTQTYQSSGGSGDGSSDTPSSPSGGGEVSVIDWDEILNKPSTYPPTGHTHTTSQITDFPEITDGHSPIVTASKEGAVTTVYVDGNPIATINDGTNGTNGHSPTITASKSGKVTTISVDGTAVATINDGNDGEQGIQGVPGSPGSPGTPGHSPVITTSKSGKTTTIYADGNAIGTVLDGNDGSSSGGGASTWDEITGKPTEFTPTAHTHEVEDVAMLSEYMDDVDTELSSLQNQIDSIPDLSGLGVAEADVTGSMTIGTSAKTLCAGKQLSVGTWLLIGYATFTGASSGTTQYVRQIAISPGTATDGAYRQRIVAPTNQTVTLCMPRLIKVTTPTTYNLNAYAGANYATSGVLQAVKLSN